MRKVFRLGLGVLCLLLITASRKVSGPLSELEAAQTSTSPGVQIDWHAKLSELEGQLSRNPHSAFLHSQVAVAYDQLNDFTSFDREIRLAMELDKNNAIYFYMAYAVYKRRNQTQREIDVLQRALEVDPTNPFGHYEKAAILGHAGKWKQALAEYEITDSLLQKSGCKQDAAVCTYTDNRGNPYDLAPEIQNIESDTRQARIKVEKQQ